MYTTIAQLKVVGAVLALAATLFLGYSVISYVTDSVSFADASVGGGTSLSHWINGPGELFIEPFPYVGGNNEPTGGWFDYEYTPPVSVPPPAPVCTLDLTSDKITWTTQNAYQVLIAPLTNSPQVPGLTSGAATQTQHSESEAYQSNAVINELATFGINLPAVQGNTGFAGDQATMNRVCVLIEGSGATAQSYYAEGYSSPSNNAIVKYTNGTWSRIPASQFNSHLRYNFTCAVPGVSTYALNGAHTFVPPLGYGTHTYKLTATGNGGSVMCEDTITIAPPPPPPPPSPEECKLEITKTASAETVAPGTAYEYTLTIKNVGNKNCTGGGVKVLDVLDQRLTFISATQSSNVTQGYGSDPTYTTHDRTVRFNADTLTPGESGWMKIKVKAAAPSACTETIPNVAKVTAFEYNYFQNFETSNTVRVTVAKDCTPPPPPVGTCALEISKTADKTQAVPGDFVWYTINFKNTGTKECTGGGVKVVDILDPGLTYITEMHSTNVVGGYDSDPVYSASDRTVRFNAATLTPGEAGWVKIKVKVGTPATCSSVIHNVAKITAYELQWVYVTSTPTSLTVTKECSTPAPVCTLGVAPTSLQPGQSATLTWGSSNVTSVSIDQGIGSVALSGSRVVNPSANTTYTGTFTGPGGTVTCQASITLTQTLTPQCTLSVSAASITSGQSVMVSWTSLNVTQGFVNAVGTTTPVSGGSAEVFPADSMTFTGTFTGPYGTATCSAPITVTRGGGGCQGNCGGGLNQPNVVMLQKPPEAPLAFVTLEQIPYTGFAAGKLLTLVFWLAVGLLAAVATYFAMGQRAIQYAFGQGLTAEYSYEPQIQAPRPTPSTVRTEVSNGYRTNGYKATVASVPVVPVVHFPQPVVSQEVATDLADTIESRAHSAGVLISPEAVQRAIELSRDRGEVLRQFGEILNDALRTLPREDGWVMLTSERFESLSGAAQKPVTLATPTSTPSVEAILSSVMPPAAPVARPVPVEMPMADADDQSVVMSLVRALLHGNREQAYATLRNLETGRANAASVMTVIAGAVDQLFRARRHGLTTELSAAALDVSDEKLAQIVEIFTHGMDASYTNPFTSLKLAVARAFEARG